MGFKLWRDERFPKVVKSLFNRLMEEVDSQHKGSSTGRSIPEDLADSCFEHDSSCNGTENNIYTDDALLENVCQFSEKMVMTKSPKQGNTANRLSIMLTSPCNEQPLTPHFYLEKVGFTRVYIFSYFCSKT